MQIQAIASRVRTLFAAQQAPAAGALGQETAVDNVLAMLMQADDPDLLLQLKSIARCDLRRLETDDEVFGALETRRDACINTPWRLEPGTGTVVDFFYEELRRFGGAMLSAAWQALPYGYSVAECVYRQDGNLVRLAKIEDKPIEWFKIDKNSTLRFVGPNGVTQAEGVPVDTTLKLLFTRHRPTYRQQYGEAILSRVYWPWFFRHNGWMFWGQFLERFGLPLLIGKVGDPAKFVKMMNELGIQSVVAVDKASDLTAVAVNGQGEFSHFESACCRRIQKAILGQTLTTDTTGKGSYALGQVHELVRQDRRYADLRVVSDTMQRWINAMTALNFPAAKPPRFVMADGRGLSPERAKRDAILAGAGVRFSRDYLLRAYDFEEGDFKIPGEKLEAVPARFRVQASQLLQAGVEPRQWRPERVAPASVGVTASGGIRLSEGLGVQLSKAGESSLQFATGDGKPKRRFTAQQQQIEDLIGNALEGMGSPIASELVRREALAASSLDDLVRRLATLMQGADPKVLRERLERALFTGEIIGYVHADKGGAKDPLVRPVPFTEAIEWARKRKVVLPDEFNGKLQGAARVKAFTVSGLSSLAQLRAVHESLVDAIAKGERLHEWQRKVEDGAIGLTLNKHRLETIFRTNIQLAYGHGRGVQQLQHARRRPYLIYDAINDERTRPGHKMLDGFIAPINDPVWQTHTPPLGYNCRCTVRSLTEEQARARGYPTPFPEGARPDEGWDYDRLADVDEGLRRAVDEALAKRADALALAARQVLDKGPGE